jgi:hypothetical protein
VRWGPRYVRRYCDLKCADCTSLRWYMIRDHSWNDYWRDRTEVLGGHILVKFCLPYISYGLPLDWTRTSAVGSRRPYISITFKYGYIYSPLIMHYTSS